jgi:hypothetical protein
LSLVTTIKVTVAQAVMQCEAMKIFAGKLSKSISWVILRQHTQQHFPFVFQSGSVREDHHSIRKKRVT